MDVSSRRLALVQHRNLPAHGLLSFLSLLSAFLLNAIKRNQAPGGGAIAPGVGAFHPPQPPGSQFIPSKKFLANSFTSPALCECFAAGVF